MAMKTITLFGEEFNFVGRDDDRYFSTLESVEASNASFGAMIEEYLPLSPIVFDVGANIGVTCSALARKRPQSKIFAFEPGIETFRLLNQNLALNHVSCATFNVALGKSAGTADFHEARMLAGSHLVTSDHPSGTSVANSKVQIRTLDDVVGELDLPTIDLIKIDVEGFALEVIQGGLKTISRFKPMVYLEINAWCLIAFSGHNPRHVLSSLREIFSKILWYKDGKWEDITAHSRDLEFIHTHLLRHACVDDLLCIC